MKKELVIEKLNGHDTSGVVGKISTQVGQRISTGDTLFTIESGKGVLTVKAEGDGNVVALLVEDGQKVTKGQIVGHLEYDSEIVSERVPQQTKATSPKAGAYNFGLSKPTKRKLHVDLAIIGGGPGGYVAAIRGAQAGLKVAIIEENRLGGTCLNHGCIPTKALVNSVSVLKNIRRAAMFGLEVPSVHINFTQMMARKNQVVDQLVGGIEYLMENHGIEHFKGRAKVESENHLSVENKQIDLTLSYEKLIIATGSKASFIPIEGYDLPDILTSLELLSLEEIPKSLTIIGGGVIGMEFAFIYRALGSEVTVVEYMPQVLALLDDDVIAVVRASADEKGIRIFEDARASSIKNTLNGQKIVEIQMDGKMHYICSDKVAMAVGRKANIDTLNLESLDVELNDKRTGIAVNTHMQTSNPNIYAIGDVTNIIQLAHVASHQGIVAVDHIGGGSHTMNYSAIPGAIFTDPEVGCVGLSEREAKATGIDYLVGKFPFAANGKALVMGEQEGFVKLIADATSRVVLGGAVVGIHATDLIAIITNFVAHKKTIDECAHVVYAHPTTAESIHESILMIDDRGIHFA